MKLNSTSCCKNVVTLPCVRLCRPISMGALLSMLVDVAANGQKQHLKQIFSEPKPGMTTPVLDATESPLLSAQALLTALAIKI